MKQITIWGETWNYISKDEKYIYVQRPTESEIHKASIFTLTDKEKEQIKD